MPIFGALAGLTAAGLYAVVDEIRVAKKVRSYQISGRLQAWDYKVNDEQFNGIIRRFENDWELDGGSLYPDKLIGFFAENPDARKQWVRMQASIILHDQMERRMCEDDTSKFGLESTEYCRLFGDAERRYICDHDPVARNAIEQCEREYTSHISTLVQKDKKSKRCGIVISIVAVLIIISIFVIGNVFGFGVITSYSSNGVERIGCPVWVLYGLLSIAAGLMTFGLSKLLHKENGILWAICMALFALIYPIACG